MNIDDLLRIAVSKGASDLHVKVGAYPMMRIAGALVPASEERRVIKEDTLAMGAAMMSQEHREKFNASQEVDLAYSVPGLGRFRCNIFQQRGTMGFVLRVIPSSLMTIEDLLLPPVLRKIADEERGLVLVTGTTGSARAPHWPPCPSHQQLAVLTVMTVEIPIEFLHRDSRSIVISAKCRWIRARSHTRYGALCDRIQTSFSSRNARFRNDRNRHPRGGDRPSRVFDACIPSTRPRQSTASSPCIHLTSRSSPLQLAAVLRPVILAASYPRVDHRGRVPRSKSSWPLPSSGLHYRQGTRHT